VTCDRSVSSTNKTDRHDVTEILFDSGGKYHTPLTQSVMANAEHQHFKDVKGDYLFFHNIKIFFSSKVKQSNTLVHPVFVYFARVRWLIGLGSWIT
jgi:hypothetical protein